MIGRVEEIAALKDALDSDESQFVAVYGRRRIGKTYLIRSKSPCSPPKWPPCG